MKTRPFYPIRAVRFSIEPNLLFRWKFLERTNWPCGQCTAARSASVIELVIAFPQPVTVKIRIYRQGSVITSRTKFCVPLHGSLWVPYEGPILAKVTRNQIVARGSWRLLGPSGGQPPVLPAWAGNTDGNDGHDGLPTDHPRVGGEHDSSAGCKSSIAGSSPRGRGTQRRRGKEGGGSRIIPAWAGNTT